MITEIVTGLKPRKYKAKYGVKEVRSNLFEEELERLVKLEEFDYTLLNVQGIKDFEMRKKFLSDYNLMLSK